MHYRSGLNMIPLIEWYRRHPEEGTFLLEVAMGAISGRWPTSTPDGRDVDDDAHGGTLLAYDPHSGDFGLGFFGNALESGAHYVEDPTLGPSAFLCEMGGGGVLTAKDAYRRAFYVEPLGLYLQTECGEIAAVTYAGATAPLTVAFGGDYSQPQAAPQAQQAGADEARRQLHRRRRDGGPRRVRARAGRAAASRR